MSRNFIPVGWYVLHLCTMKGQPDSIPTVFNPHVWQTHYDTTQQPMLLALQQLSADYLKAKADYETATPDKKKMLHYRTQHLQKLICALDESYHAGRDYVGSLCTTLHTEYLLLSQTSNRELDEMHQAYLLITDTAIKLCEKNL